MPHLRIIWQDHFFLNTTIIKCLLSVSLLIIETLKINNYMEDLNAPFKNNMTEAHFSKKFAVNLIANK